MASSSKPRVRSHVANGAINPRSFVKLDVASPATGKAPNIVQCGANDSPYGVTLNESAAASGDTVEVGLPGGGAILHIQGTITAGQSIKSNASGYGVAASTAGDRVGAQAGESGVTGDDIGVEVERFEKNNSDAT
jgi:hypothetical protein